MRNVSQSDRQDKATTNPLAALLIATPTHILSGAFGQLGTPIREYNLLIAPINSLLSKTMTKPPTPLYRFRTGSLNTLSELVDNYIWLANSVSFNDPFEFDFKLDLTGVKVKNKSKNQSIEQMTNTAKNFLMKAGIACFTTVLDSILMWSHYSQNHTGVVVQYDMSAFADSIHKVDYVKEKPVLSPREFLQTNSSEERKKVIARTLSTKYIKWRYEREWRLIGNRSMPFQFGKIKPVTAIYLGVNTQKRFENLILSFARKAEIRVYRMGFHPSEYKLEPTSVSF